MIEPHQPPFHELVCLVTGAASGIGRACVERLAADGAMVIATDVQAEAGAELAAEQVEAGARVRFYEQDVADATRWKDIVATIEAEHGPLHVLVNNAGIGMAGGLLDTRIEDFRRQQSINVEGVFLGMQTAMPALCRGGYGSIVNVSSLAGLRGTPNLLAYSATKAAVALMTKSVALECGQKGWPVRVNSVHPGLIDTPIWSSVPTDFFEAGANSVDLDTVAAGVALGRPGQAAEIASAVRFLAGPDSSYMTGAEVVVDGGMNA
ncbi:MAG: SDR family oxidoreductase [Pseudomonadota bacterium]